MKSSRLLISFLSSSLVFLLLINFSGYSQDGTGNNVKTVADTLNRKIEDMKSDFELWKKLKFSGYIQPQFQLADSAGISTFAGGSFPKNSESRFTVRRGRLKATYDGQYSKFVIQIDVTEKGVAIKDAYMSLKDPWLQMFTVTGGVFNRPFGYEIAYSSSQRESPERARITQTLFPGERDLGAMLTIQAPKESRLNFLKLDLGLISGNGLASETDSRKDFLAHLYASRTTRNEKINYGLGISYYHGGYFQETKNVYQLETMSDGMTTGYVADSTDSNKGAYSDRDYYGVDAQFSIDWLPGITTLRGEYIQGNQPSTAKSNISPSNRSIPDIPVNDTYNRPFRGGYIYLVQNIGQSRHSFVVKYDWFDPNTELKGEEMTSSIIVGENEINTRLSAADIMYTTWGFGYNLRLTSNVKLMAYYDLVKNETATIKGFSQDLKDNVFTLRLQFKF